MSDETKRRPGRPRKGDTERRIKLDMVRVAPETLDLMRELADQRGMGVLLDRLVAEEAARRLTAGKEKS